MSPQLISTQEVASMLNVTETTIKRWADESILPCVRTPGGHRKFLLHDIVSFAERNGYTLGGSKPPVLRKKQMEHLQLGIHTSDYSRIAEVIKEVALRADRDEMVSLLLYLYKNQIPFSAIIDKIVKPAFDTIGEQWEQGNLEVNQEHTASYTMIQSLARILSDLHHKKSNGLTVVCACPEGELHEIGLLGASYSFEIEGWKTHYIGANTPFETLKSLIRVTKPDLVCLSITIGWRREMVSDNIKELASLVHSYGGKIIVGGYFVTNAQNNDLRVDHIAHSIQDAMSYVREAFNLKPGPKRKKKKQAH